MSNEPLTEEDVLASIVPDSTQFNASDCVDGPMTFTIDHCTKGTKQQPVNIHLVGHERVYRPGKTCTRVIKAMWGKNPNKWVGKSFTLFTDTSVKYKGVSTGGLRISHASGFTEDKKIPVRLSQTKVAEVIVHPLTTEPEPEPELSPEDKEFIATAEVELKEADSLDELTLYGQVLHGKSPAVQDALRTLYMQRKQDLEKAAQAEETT